MSVNTEEKKPGLPQDQSVDSSPTGLPHQESFHQLTEFEKPWGIVRVSNKLERTINDGGAGYIRSKNGAI
jgi:hypothetical protein